MNLPLRPAETSTLYQRAMLRARKLCIANQGPSAPLPFSIILSVTAGIRKFYLLNPVRVWFIQQLFTLILLFLWVGLLLCSTDIGLGHISCLGQRDANRLDTNMYASTVWLGLLHLWNSSGKSMPWAEIHSSCSQGALSVSSLAF